MHKHFCDLCGKEAAKAEQIKVSVKHGQPYWSGPIQWQCQVVLRASFEFEQHPTGCGGPPDLCQGCVNKLVLMLGEKTGTYDNK